MRSFIATLIVIALAVIGIDVVEPVYGIFGKVPVGHVGIVTTFGEVSDYTLDAGFHVKNPFARITRMDVRTQVETGTYAAFSSDIQQVEVSLTVNYNVDKDTAMNLFREVGTDYFDTIMMPRIKENAKVVISHYTAEALVENREILSEEMLKLMQNDMVPYGISVTTVSIEDIDFTEAFTDAVEAKQVATQNKLAAQTEEEKLTMQKEAEAERAIIEAEAQAERDKINAEANAEVTKINADTAAYAVRIEAEAQAEANLMIAESITDELMFYDVLTKWNGILPYYFGGDALPVIDISSEEVWD